MDTKRNYDGVTCGYIVDEKANNTILTPSGAF